MDIKANVVRLLQEQGKTQLDLCKSLGVTTQSLQYYFKANLTLSNLQKIADALNVEPWQLLKPVESSSDPQRPQLVCPHCGYPLTITID